MVTPNGVPVSIMKLSKFYLKTALVFLLPTLLLALSLASGREDLCEPGKANSRFYQ